MRYLCETLGNRENCQLTYLTTEIAGCVMEERAQKDRRRGERGARWKCRERDRVEMPVMKRNQVAIPRGEEIWRREQ